jgi:hypothetical protein
MSATRRRTRIGAPMPDVKITDVINLGLMPFVLYMAYLFWTALQKANEKHDIVIERLMEILQVNTKALDDNVARSIDVSDKVCAHDEKVSAIDDKIDMIGSTTNKIDVRTVHIEALLQQRQGKPERAL